MVKFNFPKVSKITKIDCPELSTLNSNFLDFHGFRKREREREREREKERERERERELIRWRKVFSLLIFHVPTVVTPS